VAAVLGAILAQAETADMHTLMPQRVVMGLAAAVGAVPLEAVKRLAGVELVILA
jgi:hypothetical protein